jgi:hypothetical protein
MIVSHYLLTKKYYRLAAMIADEFGVSVREAVDILYTSETYHMMCHGIADMHCRSDGYLLDEIRMERAAVLSETPWRE